jgi:hypothetical protein
LKLDKDMLLWDHKKFFSFLFNILYLLMCWDSSLLNLRKTHLRIDCFDASFVDRRCVCSWKSWSLCIYNWLWWLCFSGTYAIWFWFNLISSLLICCFV